MRKGLGILFGLAALVSSVSAVQRVVVIEEFTSTTCPNCPTTASALHQLEQEAKDSLVVLAYHSGTDPYKTTETNDRGYTFYQIPGTPVIIFDAYYAANSPNYTACRNFFNLRKVVAPQMTIALTGSYNSSARTGSIKAHVTNTTSGSLTGVLQVLVVETDISYSWEGQSMLYSVVRDMIPYDGTSKTLAGGASTDVTQSFTINSGWNASNCSIVCFFQQISTSALELYQGAKTSLTSIAAEEQANNKDQSASGGAKIEISENPVCKNADISYSLSNYTNVRLIVYDISGKAVRTVVKKAQSSGNYKVNFESKELCSGIYFAELQAGNQRDTKKFILMK